MTEEKIKRAIRLMQREYLQKWRKANPDKVKQYNTNYWRRKVLKNQERSPRNGSNATSGEV